MALMLSEHFLMKDTHAHGDRQAEPGVVDISDLV